MSPGPGTSASDPLPAATPASRVRRLAWFFGLWFASVSVTFAVAGALRWLFRQMLR